MSTVYNWVYMFKKKLFQFYLSSRVSTYIYTELAAVTVYKPTLSVLEKQSSRGHVTVTERFIPTPVASWIFSKYKLP